MPIAPLASPLIQTAPDGAFRRADGSWPTRRLGFCR